MKLIPLVFGALLTATMVVSCCSDPAPDACDDGNPCTTEAFSKDRCVFKQVPFGTVCGEADGLCMPPLACDGAGACTVQLPVDDPKCVEKARVVSAHDARIGGAKLTIPAGRAPRDQTFTITAEEAIPQSSLLDGFRTYGPVVSVLADSVESFAFAPSDTGECVELQIPFDGALLARSPAFAQRDAAVFQVAGDEMVPLGGRVDRSSELATVCITHLSNYVVASAATCHPLRFNLRYDEEGLYRTPDSTPTSYTLDSPVTLAIPAAITVLEETGYIELSFDPDLGVCRYGSHGEFRNCSNGQQPGDYITSRQFGIGSETVGVAVQIIFDPELAVATCPESCAPVPDNCGGMLNCAEDGNACTTDVCDPTADAALHEPRPEGTLCSDDNPCDGAESCNADGVCNEGTPPVLDDSDPCTADRCDPNTGVTHGEAFQNCKARLSDFLQSWCPSGVVASFNQPYYEYCLKSVVNSVVSARTAQDEESTLEVALACLSSSVICEPTSSAGTSSKRFPQILPPAPFNRRWCTPEKQKASEDCAIEVARTMERALFLCPLTCLPGMLAGPEGCGAAILACYTEKIAEAIWDTFACTLRNSIAGDECCPATATKKKEIKCNGQCVAADRCP